ncbi:hypothetical protein KAU15_00245, partial [candidate division WOR-3 bacterium]|nr:hypothetical protein [candidate division WOR-3 bacterium]
MVYWSYNWGVEFGENIGVQDGNKIYLFDNNLNIYDSIVINDSIKYVCNSIDCSKLIIYSANNISIYNVNNEMIGSFQLDYNVSGMDIDAMDRLYFRNYDNNEIKICDLSGNEISVYLVNEGANGTLFGGNNRVREFTINNYGWGINAIDIMDIASNELGDLPLYKYSNYGYDYAPLMEDDKGIIVRNDRWQSMNRYNTYHKKSGIWTYLLDMENDDTYFENISVNKYIPDGTSIGIKFRTSNDSTNINNTIWSNCYNENEFSLNGLQGRFLEIQAQLSTMDSTVSPYLQGLEINTNSGITYFAADTIISDIDAGTQYSLNWNTLVPEQTGEYYMKGKIRNKYEQLLYRGEDKFDVIGSDYAILLQTDKEYYKPYKNIDLSIKLFNLTDIDDDFTFKLYKDDDLYLDTTIFISDSVIINKSFSGYQSFSINTFLFLTDTICEKNKKIFIYAPDIMAELQCDDE